MDRAEIDGSGWLSKTDARSLFKFVNSCVPVVPVTVLCSYVLALLACVDSLQYDDLKLISPIRSDGFSYTYYNRSDVEQLAQHANRVLPDPAAVSAKVRGAFDVNLLSPKRKGAGRGMTWTKAMQKHPVLKKRHQVLVKPYLVEPSTHEKGRGQAIKRYYTKEIEELAESVAAGTVPATSPASSPRASTSAASTPSRSQSSPSKAKAKTASPLAFPDRLSSSRKRDSDAVESSVRVFTWDFLEL